MENPARRPDMPPPNATDLELVNWYEEMLLWADTWNCIIGMVIWMAVIAVCAVSGIALGLVLSL